ncbi:MAG: hypothetical protein HGA19_03910 [Oscillochloris sp.]|nr:hypothetical protein [Oscillochloris sp.]
MAITELSQDLRERQVHQAEVGTDPIHTRFGAAPRPHEPISEPRYIHALMFAAWLGRLIDPVDMVHHASEERHN